MKLVIVSLLIWSSLTHMHQKGSSMNQKRQLNWCPMHINFTWSLNPNCESPLRDGNRRTEIVPPCKIPAPDVFLPTELTFFRDGKRRFWFVVRVLLSSWFLHARAQPMARGARCSCLHEFWNHFQWTHLCGIAGGVLCERLPMKFATPNCGLGWVMLKIVLLEFTPTCALSKRSRL